MPLALIPPPMCENVCVLHINRSGLNHTKYCSIGYSIVANPVGGLLDRKISKEHLQSYNESSKIYIKQDKKGNKNNNNNNNKNNYGTVLYRKDRY